MAQPTVSPELQSILAALAQYAPQPASNGLLRSVGQSSSPDDLVQTLPSSQVSHSLRSSSCIGGTDGTAVTPNPETKERERSIIDPATITVWEEGLRCVTKIAVQNVHFAGHIRTMIRTQHKIETQWWHERLDLKRDLARRKASSMNSLAGGESHSTADERPIIDAEAELLAFDRKIHDAQQTVGTDMSTRLKALGVPFFGTDENLIVSNELEPSQLRLPNDHPKWSPIISESKLHELQMRMISHLEALYKD